MTCKCCEDFELRERDMRAKPGPWFGHCRVGVVGHKRRTIGLSNGAGREWQHQDIALPKQEGTKNGKSLCHFNRTS